MLKNIQLKITFCLGTRIFLVAAQNLFSGQQFLKSYFLPLEATLRTKRLDKERLLQK